VMVEQEAEQSIPILREAFAKKFERGASA